MTKFLDKLTNSGEKTKSPLKKITVDVHPWGISAEALDRLKDVCDEKEIELYRGGVIVQSLKKTVGNHVANAKKIGNYLSRFWILFNRNGKLSV